MNEFISSPWFESLHLATQIPLVLLFVFVTGATSCIVLNAGKRILTATGVIKSAKTPAATAPRDLCKTLLHLLEQFAPWSTAVAGDKELVRFLTHVNGRVRIEFGTNRIAYILAGSDIGPDLSSAELALLDEAAVRRKDATLAALAACGEGQGHTPHMTRDEYQAALRGGTVLPPAPPVKR